MTPFTRSLTAGTAAAALTAAVMFALYRRDQSEIHGLRASNDETLFEIAMRSKQVSASVPSISPSPKTQAIVKTPSEIQEAVHSAYRDAGQATPIATLQTIAWACDRGDTGRLATMLHFDPAARERAEAYMRTLPEEARGQGQWSSPEQMAAALIAAASIHQPFPENDILDRATEVQQGPDRTLLRLPGTLKDNTEYQRVGETWKYVLTETIVNRYLQSLADRDAGP